jgi:preprotein translocase subunit SecD
VVLEDAEGNRYRLGHVILSQDNINDAQARHDESIGAPAGSWTVEISLDGDGTDQLASATQAAASAAPPTNQIAVVVDGRVMIAPTVQAPITSGRLEVTGLEESQAQALVALGTVSPTA